MLKIAHRGASGYEPENTLAAFRKAIELGADAIELDVHQCKSGQLIVIHDDTVDRTTSGHGCVAEMHVTTLRDELHIPTLADVLDTIGKDVTYFIECKHDNSLMPAAQLVEQSIAQGFDISQLWLITFRLAALRKTLMQFPKLYAGASFEHITSASIKEAKDIGARAILPHFKTLTSAKVDEAHKTGLQVFTWTANEVADIARIYAMGVDGIMSDYPDRIAKAHSADDV